MSTDKVRADALNVIYRHTHPDYKGKTNGVRSILIYRNGTCLVPLDALTDDEISAQLPYATRKEADRLAKKAAKP